MPFTHAFLPLVPVSKSKILSRLKTNFWRRVSPPRPTGFSGSRCEVNINDCLSSPCLNNGTCLDQVDGYLCDCLSGFRQEAERIKNLEFKARRRRCYMGGNLYSKDMSALLSYAATLRGIQTFPRSAYSNVTNQNIAVLVRYHFQRPDFQKLTAPSAKNFQISSQRHCQSGLDGKVHCCQLRL